MSQKNYNKIKNLIKPRGATCIVSACGTNLNLLQKPESTLSLVIEIADYLFKKVELIVETNGDFLYSCEAEFIK